MSVAREPVNEVVVFFVERLSDIRVSRWRAWRSMIVREKRTDFTAKECRCLGSDVKIKGSRLMSQGYRTTYCLKPGA